SYHWLATFLCIVLLVLCLRPAGGTTWAFVLGVDIGLLMAVHQQRGLSMGLGVAALIVALTIMRWFYGLPADRSTVWRQLGAFAAGVTVVVGSLMLALVATAGMQPVWDALVVVPLVDYRGRITSWSRWGIDYTGGRRFPFSSLLPYLPIT